VGVNVGVLQVGDRSRLTDQPRGLWWVGAWPGRVVRSGQVRSGQGPSCGGGVQAELGESAEVGRGRCVVSRNRSGQRWVESHSCSGRNSGDDPPDARTRVLSRPHL